MSGALTASVTEVRNALRCPRVFALGRALGRTVLFPLGSSSLGATFHRLVDRFARLVDDPPGAMTALGPRAPRKEIERALVTWLLGGYLLPELEDNAVYATMPAEVDDLAEALRQFAAYIAALVASFDLPPAEALRALVDWTELSLEVPVDLGGGEVMRLTGRIDALLRREGGQAEVVEYKLTSDENDELDRAQASLYRFLLRERLGIDALPVVMRFEPALRLARIGGAEADQVVKTRLLPLLGDMARWATTPALAPATTRADLCVVCPMRAPCASAYPARLEARDAPPATSSLPRPDAAGALSLSSGPEPSHTPAVDDSGPAEAGALAARILAEFKRRSVNARISRQAIGPRLLRLDVSVSPRQSVTELDRAAKDVEFQIANDRPGPHPNALCYRREGTRRYFLAERAQPRRVELGRLLHAQADWLRERPGRFVLGEGVEGDVVVGDLSDGGSNHLLIAGQTGSGKSVLIRSLLLSLAHFHPPAALRFTLVDPKLVTFSSPFRTQLGAHGDGPVLHEVEGVLARLEALEFEMRARLERFQRAGVENILDFNLASREAEKLPRLLLVVDEFQDLAGSKALQKAFFSGVQRLGAMARASGIHLVLSTQNPTVQVVPSGLKANLTGRVALRVQSQVNSRVILDQPGAELLLGRGDLLANLGQGIVRAQAPSP